MKVYYSAKVNYKCNNNLSIAYIFLEFIINKLRFYFSNKFTGKKWHDRRKVRIYFELFFFISALNLFCKFFLIISLNFQVLTPAFHFNILERFVETFDRISHNVVEKLNKFDATDDVEFYPIALLYALDVMCGELKS